jgi:hypothetical protein
MGDSFELPTLVERKTERKFGVQTLYHIFEEAINTRYQLRRMERRWITLEKVS